MSKLLSVVFGLLMLIIPVLYGDIPYDCHAGGGPYKYVSVNITDIHLFKTFDYGKNCNMYFKIIVKNKEKCWGKVAGQIIRARYQTRTISIPQNGTKSHHAILTPKINIAPVKPGAIEIYIEVWDSDYGRDVLIARFLAQPMSQNTNWINMSKHRTFFGKVRFYFRN